MVILGERQLKGAAFANFHAQHCLLKFFEHLAFPHYKLKVAGFAAFKGLAIELAFKVHRDTVGVCNSRFQRALCKSAALFTQNFQGFLNGGVIDFSVGLFNLYSRKVTHFDFGVHLKHGVKHHLSVWGVVFFRDAGLTGHAQLGFIGGLGKSLTYLVVQHLVLHRVAVALGHHVHGHLARPKAVHFDGAGNTLEAGVHFRLNDFGGQGQSDFAF